MVMAACVAAAGCSREAGDAPAASRSAVGEASDVPSTNPSWDPGKGEPVVVKITASKDGFDPQVAEFIKGRPAILEFVRLDDTSCVNAVRMPWMKAPKRLPKGEKVRIAIPDTSQVGQFSYSCWMEMIHGQVVIREADAQVGGQAG
jgi:hypothetical protein